MVMDNKYIITGNMVETKKLDYRMVQDEAKGGDLGKTYSRTVR
jgi:hypothetical protein